MAGTGRAQGGDAVPDMGAIEPVMKLGADAARPIWAALAGDDEQHTISGNCRGFDSEIEHLVGTFEAVIVKIDDPVGREAARAELAVPAAV